MVPCEGRGERGGVLRREVKSGQRHQDENLGKEARERAIVREVLVTLARI